MHGQPSYPFLLLRGEGGLERRQGQRGGERRNQNLRDLVIYEAPATAIAYDQEAIRTLEERQARLGPPFFLNVPSHYQLVHHLVVDGNGDIWLYVKSHERTGFLRIGPGGRERGFYTLDADFDLLTARVTISGDQMFFMSADLGETEIYVAALPDLEVDFR